MKSFAVRVLRLGDALPRGRAGDIIARQLIRCGTSIGANYRAACRAKSPADFVAKLAIAEEEADEVTYWLDLVTEAKLVKPPRLDALRKEANELTAILVASIKTARRACPVSSRRSAAGANPKSKIQNPKSQGGVAPC
jgi:four helix bundle protein